MSDCSLANCDGDYEEVWEHKESIANDDMSCLECGNAISAGTTCIFFYIEEDEDLDIEFEQRGYTCLDCWSTMQVFEANVYDNFWQDLHEKLVECGGDVELGKLDRLSPKAREKVASLIDDIIEDMED